MSENHQLEAKVLLLAPLVALSRHYGSNPSWVLAGGGNTSFKTDDKLYVKASGFALGSIDASGFCEMERSALDAIWGREYPADKDERENAVLTDLMAARAAGETKRPSVETLLHGFFPQSYVVHTHPTIANGLTCSLKGESIFRWLFDRNGIWVPLVDPGYTLAVAVRTIFDEYVAKEGKAPSFMFMQNHGLLVAGDTPEEIEAVSRNLVKILEEAIGAVEGAQPDERAAAVDLDELGAFAGIIRPLAGSAAAIAHRADRMIAGFAADADAFAPIAKPFTPDHIVYAGHEYLRVDSAAELPAAWADYAARNGQKPRIVLARGLGAFAIGSGSSSAAARAAAARSMDLFVDSCKVATCARAFGGPRSMTPEAVAFIRNWEVEKYRSSVAAR